MKSGAILWVVNLLDLFLLGVLAIAAFSGFRRGALLQLLTYGGLLGGLVLGAVLAPALARIASEPTQQAGIAVGTLLAGAGIGDAVGWFLGSHLQARARGTRFRPADAAGGSLVAIVAVLLSIWFIGLNLVAGPFPSLAGQIRGSAIVRVLGETLPRPPSLLGEVRGFLDRFGFPEVFAGLPPAPAERVQAPSQVQEKQAFDAAAPSTVRIVGKACGEIQEGSGFVVAPSYVVTNAHVVAGMEAPAVQGEDGSSQRGTTILYDPRIDVAVLRVARSPGPSLHLSSTEVGRGAKGAVLGYPGGGDLESSGAAVRRGIPAVGRDIYGRGIVNRDVYELQAVVRPGDSGGPFVLTDGEVAGVVFAASTTDAGIGYAIASTDVQPDVDRALSSPGEVSSGPCVR